MLDVQAAPRRGDSPIAAVVQGGVIHIVKHVIVETTEERDRQIEQVEAAIRSRFPEATTEVVQGLLDEDRVVEARLPVHRLAEWRAQRSQLLAEAPDVETDDPAGPDGAV